ncbi:MAG: hypothetical protein MUQ43_11255 [Reinekea forsetii]|jgi:hypothetical protein|uniref:Lipoprotein n=1 Tax=Reinekea forsetii TaxID=1336806 RepID=A0A2K8KJX9_9GAMM|nr:MULTISPECIES: hypothetical protein [Reinekea]ATX75325.1 hypothetical protein REIFOR_00148 [Reinekea forsetii]MDO7641970.1 hypothetical protein [Reinekea forsetii]MDO7643158.1 hypothetical protein [Reinekea forsetii]MDO7674994.1 hypothetical protein [Reinekea forsetii]
MKNSIISTLWLLIGTISLSGCALFGGASRVPVSDYLRQQFSLQEAELKQLQVYVSSTIVLERVTDSSGADIAAGELNVFGERLEQIVIKPSTPGIILQATETWAKVSFSEGTWLIFGSFAASPNDPWGGKYALYAQTWAGGVGELEFNGLSYRAIKTSGQAVLEIRQKDLNRRVIEKTKLSGVPLAAE